MGMKPVHVALLVCVLLLHVSGAFAFGAGDIPDFAFLQG